MKQKKNQFKVGRVIEAFNFITDIDFEEFRELDMKLTSPFWGRLLFTGREKILNAYLHLVGQLTNFPHANHSSVLKPFSLKIQSQNIPEADFRPAPRSTVDGSRLAQSDARSHDQLTAY